MAKLFANSYVSDVLGSLFDRRSDTQSVATDDSFPQLAEQLLATTGEAQELKLARAVLLKYNSADPAERREIFNYLTWDLDLDAKVVADAVAAYRAQGTIANYRALQAQAAPPRIALFRKLANLRGGAKCLVQIREDLRKIMRKDEDFQRLDHDLHRVLESWFNRGFLVLQPINWQSPAHILEKIIAYEAVHAIGDWDDLRRRLQPSDRRCYAFFHPRMPDDPIIFVEVALTSEIPNSIQAVLAEDREVQSPEALNTATFYSISNCHAGLAGISFGNALIKQVAQELAAELPHLQTFVTLSPVPGLVKWTDANPDANALPLAQRAAQYLTQTKRKNGRPVDPVARFHLGNGAALHAIHENANASHEGAMQSHGVMVNYLYDLAQVDARAEAFALDKTVAQSSAVAELTAPKSRPFRPTKAKAKKTA